MQDVSTLVYTTILVGMVVEAFILSAWLRRNGKASLIRPLLLFLASGGLVLMALIGTTIGGQWFHASALLLAGGVCHILCLRLVFQLFTMKSDVD